MAGFKSVVAPDLELTGECVSTDKSEKFVFLHLESLFESNPRTGDPIGFRPVLPNLAWLEEKDEYPCSAKAQLFIDNTSHKFETVRSVVLGKACLLAGVFGNDPHHPDVNISLSSVASEFLCLGWPLAWVSRSFRSVPAHHRGWFYDACRMFGRMVEKNIVLRDMLHEYKPVAMPSREILALCKISAQAARSRIREKADCPTAQ
jgi:hypothetical protein